MFEFAGAAAGIEEVQPILSHLMRLTLCLLTEELPPLLGNQIN